jgi:uridylate kinase
VLDDPTRLPSKGKKPIYVSGGFEPGASSDHVAVLLAKTFGAGIVANLSNIDYAYTKDPRKHSDAVKIERTDWKSFRKIVGNKWVPGANTPFDPIASKVADQEGIEVAILNGKKLKNLENYLYGKEFKGTVIEK